MSTVGMAARMVGNRRLGFGIAVLFVAVALLVVLSVLLPAQMKAVLRGWLIAFAIFGTVPVGSMIWLLIHRLTGGQWGFAAAPVLRSAAAMTPLLLIAFVPLLTGLAQIYPWAAEPSAISADVAHWYLNALSFSFRGLITLAGWSLLALVFAAGSGSRLLAGLGLAFFGLTISLIAVDWYLSLEPHYVATAFAAMIAIQQLLAALAVATLLGPRVDGKVAGDLGGLLIATLLGVVYLEYMTFVVAWYGDLPDKAKWFMKRASPGWLSVLIAALLIGALMPFSMLMVKTIRRSCRGLRIASALILFGSALHFSWLLVPAFDDEGAAIMASAAGLAVLVSISFLIGPAVKQVLEVRHAR